MDIQFDLWTLLVAGASGGTAWGGTLAGMKGTRKEVAETKEALEKHTEADHKMQLETVQRLARIEALLLELKDR